MEGQARGVIHGAHTSCSRKVWVQWVPKREGGKVAWPQGSCALATDIGTGTGSWSKERQGKERKKKEEKEQKRKKKVLKQ